MVFVWSQLTKGDPNYTLVQLSVNDLIVIFAFAPIAALLLGVSDIAVPSETLLLSTMLYVLLPLIGGFVTRKLLRENVGQLVKQLKPWSMAGLLATVVLLFALQIETILSQPMHIALIAIPLIIQSHGIFLVEIGRAHV